MIGKCYIGIMLHSSRFSDYCYQESRQPEIDVDFMAVETICTCGEKFVNERD